MAEAGTITLRRLAEHTTAIDVACARCPKTWRFRLEALIRQHGARASVGCVLDAVTVDCPHRAGHIYERCSTFSRDLSAFFMRR